VSDLMSSPTSMSRLGQAAQLVLSSVSAATALKPLISLRCVGVSAGDPIGGGP
jgi:hypothetical protein